MKGRNDRKRNRKRRVEGKGRRTRRKGIGKKRDGRRVGGVKERKD